MSLDESLLTNIPPFRKLSDVQIREVLHHATPRRFAPGMSIFEQGAEADKFYLLLDGHVRVTRLNEDGEQVIMLHIVSGHLLGIAPAMGRSSYPATASAADECLTLSWPTRLWPEFIERYDGFATETYKDVGDRVEEMQKRIIEQATKNVEQRVASALLRLINQSGKKVDRGIEIDFPITRQHISEMTGTTLHTVSRLMSTWEKDGIVASRRKRVVVLLPQRLMALSAPRS